MKFFKNLFRDDAGATAIEYGLIAAAMGLALVAVMPTLGNTMQGKFELLNTAIAAQ